LLKGDVAKEEVCSLFGGGFAAGGKLVDEGGAILEVALEAERDEGVEVERCLFVCELLGEVGVSFDLAEEGLADGDQACDGQAP
jgi:hypothetical protein